MESKNEAYTGVSVCHMTSSHKSNDIRVFQKECSSIAERGYKTYLVAQGSSREENGVNVIGIGVLKNKRFTRMTSAAREIYTKANSLDCDVYHFHDPELLMYGKRLARKGKIVIYDSHEDYPSLIIDKDYIPKLLRPMVSRLFQIYERNACKHFAGVSACYQWTLDRLSAVCKCVRIVQNYPIINPETIESEPDYRSRTIAYAGSVSQIYNLDVIIKAIDIDTDRDVKVLLAGDDNSDYFQYLKKLQGWNKVKYIGNVEYKKVFSCVHKKSAIAVVLLDYLEECKRHIGTLANNKFYEAMVNALPLVCTNFSLWEEIIRKHKCGICVNPKSIDEVRAAINYLIDNPDIARTMGANGRNAILNEYNWDTAKTELYALYDSVLNITVGE